MRRLYDEELEELSETFITYLITQGVDADYWKELKSSDPDKANKIVDEFSHHYFNIMLSGIHYLKFEDEKVLHCIHFTETLKREIIYSRSDDNIGFKESNYTNDVQLEKFNTLEKGYKPDDGSTYKRMVLLYAESKMSLFNIDLGYNY